MNENISAELPESPPREVTGGAAGISKAPPRRKEKMRARLVQGLSLLGLVVVLLLLWHFFGAKSDKAASKPRTEIVPVEMAAATQLDVAVQIKSIGNIEPVSTIAVRSQIEGTLQTVTFTPGQEVTKGQALFTIDPRPLQAALSQVQANLAKAMAAVSQGRSVVVKDQATAVNSRTIVNRDVQLLEAGVISREEYDNAVAKAQSDEATVKADQSSVDSLVAAAKAEQATVDNARVQLGYTTIRAPISGKTGSLVVTAGNLVRANDTTPMVTITQASPVYVTFSVPEQDLQRIRQYATGSEFKTEVVIPGDESNPAQGRLSLVDNTVDTTTGTIRLKATFDNGDRRLYPGLFANVVLTLGVQHEAIVVPSQAVQIGQDSSFVYAVKPDMTVEVRKVKTGTSLNNLTVIEEGIKPGDQVVTDGQLRLVPGSTVQQKSGQPGASPGNRRNGGANPAAGASPAAGSSTSPAASASASPNAGGNSGGNAKGQAPGGRRGP